MTLVSCAGCEQPILDRFIFNVLDRPWHQSCIQCIDCQSNLNEKCFSRNGKLFCKDDFFKRFGPKCAGCNIGISPQDLVRRARDRVFHLKCFTCCVCRKQLSTGEQLYIIDENRFMCKTDYLQNKLQDVSDDEQLDKPSKHIKTFNCFGQQKHFPRNDVLVDTYMIENPSDSSSSSILIKQEPAIDTSSQQQQHHELFHKNSHHHQVLNLNKENSNKKLMNSASEALIKNDTFQQLNSTGIANSNNNNFSTLQHSSSNHIDSNAEKENLLINSSTDSSDLYDNNSKDANCTDNLLDDNEFIDSDKDEDSEDEGGMNGKHSSSSSTKDDGNNLNGKKRGPRTTIKAKQLEMLKSAFSATPKPTRHIREQLAQETGLNMRVIQVWFQNRRSKERRMKQLSALGNRRHYYRNTPRIAIDAPNSNIPTPNRSITDLMNTTTGNSNSTQLISTARGNRFDMINENNDMIGQQNNGGSLNYMNTGEFYTQSNFNEFLIQNENQLQRMNYPPMDHNLLNSEVTFSLNHDAITTSSSSDEIDRYTNAHAINGLLSQNYPSTPNGAQGAQSLNTQGHELETVW